MMKPLEEWICDSCRELTPLDQGWLEWRHDEEMRALDFRICHQAHFSPIRKRNEEGRGPSCYKHSHAKYRADLGLRDMTDTHGMAAFLSMLDMGRIIDPDAKQLVKIADMPNYVETFRRLFVPHYEEARQYMGQAEADGYYADGSESFPYTQGALLGVIENYNSED